MKEISYRREQRLLNKIINGRYALLGWGSTRATFAISESVVAKITVDLQFVGQNNNEVEVAKKDNGAHTTRIYAYGKRIILAERVVPIDENEWYGEEYETEEEAREPSQREIDRITNFLRKMGINPDGNQYGFTKDGRLVSYDYGYADDGCRGYQVGGVEDCYDMDDIVEKIAESGL